MNDFMTITKYPLYIQINYKYGLLFHSYKMPISAGLYYLKGDERGQFQSNNYVREERIQGGQGIL